jgi:hypothetical protein
MDKVVRCNFCLPFLVNLEVDKNIFYLERINSFLSTVLFVIGFVISNSGSLPRIRKSIPAGSFFEEPL